MVLFCKPKRRGTERFDSLCASISLWLGFLFLSPGAQGFVSSVDASGNVRRWNFENPAPEVPTNSLNRIDRSIRFYLPIATSNPGAEQLERNALRAAFAQWQAVPEAAIRFEEAGLVGDPDINTEDHTNTVFFAKSQFINGGRDSIAGRGVGLTYFKLNASNEVMEADIVLNDYEYDWFADYFDTTNNNYFIESAVLHEIGHLLGLDHSPVGGATMFARSLRGLNCEIGLSADDQAGARTLYPQFARATLAGLATLDGSPLAGGVVSLEDANGNLVQSTVTKSDGHYRLESIPAGSFNLRATPLDPSGGSSLTRLVSGADISADYVAAMISFKPTTNVAVSIAAGSTQTQNFAFATAQPAMRITRIIPPAPAIATAINAPAQIGLGASGVIVGVAGPTLPTNNATFEVSGSGVTVGPTRFGNNPFGTSPALHVVYASISVDTNAAPGLRTLSVQSNGEVAYANGFLEIPPAVPDDNFDGLDDRFQRKYFPLFTSADAAPGADPDADGFDNAGELIAGTDPTSAASFLQVESILYDASGAHVRWFSGDGKRYQLWGRDQIDGAPWQTVGPVATGRGGLMEQIDSAARVERYYRVAALP